MDTNPYALYIASLVFPTLVAYVFGNPDMIPSSIESVTSAMTKSAMVRPAYNRLVVPAVRRRPKGSEIPMGYRMG